VFDSDGLTQQEKNVRILSSLFVDLPLKKGRHLRDIKIAHGGARPIIITLATTPFVNPRTLASAKAKAVAAATAATTAAAATAATSPATQTVVVVEDEATSVPTEEEDGGEGDGEGESEGDGESDGEGDGKRRAFVTEATLLRAVKQALASYKSKVTGPLIVVSVDPGARSESAARERERRAEGRVFVAVRIHLSLSLLPRHDVFHHLALPNQR
jgi:hypothetical protein